MRRYSKAVRAALVAATVLLPLSGATASDLALEEVAPGVWAGLQEDPVRFNDSNSVVIVSEDDVLVVDSQGNPATVRRPIADIRERTDKPVRYLVNTHFHGDHTRGNFIYRDEFPGLEIIGHPTQREDIAAAKEVLADLESIEWALPTQAATEAFLASNGLALLRPELTAGDTVAEGNFDRFVPASFERAYLEARSELPD